MQNLTVFDLLEAVQTQQQLKMRSRRKVLELKKAALNKTLIDALSEQYTGRLSVGFIMDVICENFRRQAEMFNLTCDHEHKITVLPDIRSSFPLRQRRFGTSRGILRLECNGDLLSCTSEMGNIQSLFQLRVDTTGAAIFFLSECGTEFMIAVNGLSELSKAAFVQFCGLLADHRSEIATSAARSTVLAI